MKRFPVLDLVLKHSLRLVLSSSLMLSACATNQNVKGAHPPQTPKTFAGAGWGAILGGAAGGLSSGSKVATGALGGAMIGAAVGSYLDTTGLVDSLQKQGVNVFALGDIIEVIIPADFLFEPNSAELQRQAYPMMNQVVQLLQQYGKSYMTVDAHTDNSGHLFNRLSLSEQQAQSVTSYLWSRGINLQRIDFNGLGNETTVASDRSITGSGYNRRIEITLWQSTPASPFNVLASGAQSEDCWSSDDPERCKT